MFDDESSQAEEVPHEEALREEREVMRKEVEALREEHKALTEEEVADEAEPEPLPQIVANIVNIFNRRVYREGRVPKRVLKQVLKIMKIYDTENAPVVEEPVQMG